MAACTSRAAPSMLRFRSNCMVMLVVPRKLGRGHLGDAGDAAELALERRGHRGGHDFRAGARKRGADGDGGEIDLRQRRYRQHAERDGACERDSDREKRGGDGAVNEGRERLMN